MVRQIFARIASVFWSPVLAIALLTTGFTMPVSAADNSTTTPTVGSKLGPGDSQKLYVCMRGFQLKDVQNAPSHYAPKGSMLWIVTRDNKDGNVLVFFTKVGEDNPPPGAPPGTPSECATASAPQKKVQKDMEYTIKAASLDNYASISPRGPIRLDIRFVQPSTRIYFDTGKDDKDEVDIFRDGHLSIALNLAEFYLAYYFTERFSVGLAVGGGIGSPAGDSRDNTVQTSGAPVLLLSYGLRMELAFISNPQLNKAFSLPPGILGPVSFVLEAGMTTGFTT